LSETLRKTSRFGKITDHRSPSFSMMKQMTFADAEYAGQRKQTRKEWPLIEMDQLLPGRV
jgi:IS5 family transposase